jgi:hypothetical protein
MNLAEKLAERPRTADEARPIESVLAPGDTPHPGKILDMIMLALFTEHRSGPNQSIVAFSTKRDSGSRG